MSYREVAARYTIHLWLRGGGHICIPSLTEPRWTEDNELIYEDDPESSIGLVMYDWVELAAVTWERYPR